jgi:branched-subunit amino acid ABC-type transport system permease component
MRGVYAEMGVTMVIESFVVIVVGGVGSLVGAVVAGLLMGQVVGPTYFAPVGRDLGLHRHGRRPLVRRISPRRNLLD